MSRSSQNDNIELDWVALGVSWDESAPVRNWLCGLSRCNDSLRFFINLGRGGGLFRVGGEGSDAETDVAELGPDKMHNEASEEDSDHDAPRDCGL